MLLAYTGNYKVESSLWGRWNASFREKHPLLSFLQYEIFHAVRTKYYALGARNAKRTVLT